MLRIRWIDEVIAWQEGIFLFLTEVEGVFVSFDEFFQALIVNFVVKIRIDSSLIVEVEESENISSLHHYEAIKPGLT